MAIKRTRGRKKCIWTHLLLHKGQPNVRAVDVRDELGLANRAFRAASISLKRKGIST